MQINPSTTSVFHQSAPQADPGLAGSKSQERRPTTSPDRVTLSSAASARSAGVSADNIRFQDAQLLTSKIFNALPLNQRTGALINTVHSFYSQLNEEDWDNFVTAALKSGEDFDAFILAASRLARQGEGAEKQLSDFLAFSAELDVENLDNFIHAVDQNPGQVFDLMKNARALAKDGDAMAAYLEAARESGSDLKKLNDILGNFIQREQGSPGLAAYLSAGLRAGDTMIDFFAATQGMGQEARNKIAAFMAEEADGLNLDYFSRLAASTADATLVTDFIDRAATLSGQDRDAFLKAGAMAGEKSGQFMEALERISPRAPESRSNFLVAAANAETKIDIFLDRIGELDMAFMASLSVADTVNFLNAADVDGMAIGTLKDTASELTGRDKSLFLYAAGLEDTDAAALMEDIDAVSPGEASELILKAANKGAEKGDATIFMKGILTDHAYQNFKTVQSHLSPSRAARLTNSVMDLNMEHRAGFLSAAAAADTQANGFVEQYTQAFSYEAQKDFLALADALAGPQKGALVKTMLKAESRAGEFIALAGKIKEDDFDGRMFDNFLQAASLTKDKGQLVRFMGYTASLEKSEKEFFLFLSSRQGLGWDMDDLLDFGEDLQKTAWLDRHKPNLETRDAYLAEQDAGEFSKFIKDIGPNLGFRKAFYDAFIKNNLAAEEAYKGYYY